MEEKFGEFFRDKNYIKIKNSLFNYRNRKEQIKKEFEKCKINNDKNKLKILDIGSGISPVSPLPKNTTYIDISVESAQIMKSWGYNAKVGNINKLDEKKESFDVIVCSEVLEHIQDHHKAIKELVRVLKEKGIIIITVPVHMKYWGEDDEFVEHFRRFDPNELKKDLENAGLKIKKMKNIGSWLERKVTLLIVKIFKRNEKLKIGDIKKNLILIANNILYYLIKISLLFSSKKQTSIMLYVCEK